MTAAWYPLVLESPWIYILQNQVLENYGFSLKVPEFYSLRRGVPCCWIVHYFYSNTDGLCQVKTVAESAAGTAEEPVAMEWMINLRTWSQQHLKPRTIAPFLLLIKWLILT